MGLKEALGKVMADIGKELDHQVAAGSHELASAIFRGDPFVMYPKAEFQKDQEQPAHGLPAEAVKQPEVQQDRGMEM